MGADVIERQLRACAARADHRETLLQLPKKIPVLAITGQQDNLTPKVCLREMQALLTAREEANNVALNAPQAPGLASPAWSSRPQKTIAPWQCVLHKGSGHLLPL